MIAPRDGSRLRLLLGLATGVAALAASVVLVGLTPPLVLVVVATVGAAWALHRLRVERAEHAALRLRRDADEAVVAERLRLARDLHDLVSHGLGMITVRTAAAVHLHARAPGDGVLLAALQDVETMSRAATVELRRMLGALRDVDEEPALQPADSLARLPEIVEGARRAGLDVDLVQDDLGEVSPGAQVAICRVVREGLANSARHAGWTQVQIRVTRGPAEVVVSIEDEGPEAGWTPRPGAGHGLSGLRERMSSLGGALVAGPRATTVERRPGFRLAATIPEETT